MLLIGCVSFLLAAGCMYAAVQYLEVLAQKRSVIPVVKVAPGREISPLVPISRDDIILVHEPVESVHQHSFRTIESVIGKRSIQVLYPDEQIIRETLTDDYLLPQKGQARYEFPLSSIMPVTELRKGDYVKVWVRYRTAAELETLPPPKHFQRKDPSAELLFVSQLATVKDSNGVEIYTIQMQPLTGEGGKIQNPFFHGSKLQTTSDTEKRYRDYRSQPSSLPAFIGFNLSDEQYRMLAEAMHYGTIQVGHVAVQEEGKTS